MDNRSISHDPKSIGSGKTSSHREGNNLGLYGKTFPLFDMPKNEEFKIVI